MKGKLIVEISPEGFKYEVKGIEGKACTEITAPLDEILARISKDYKRRYKREYYQETNKTKIKQKW